MFANQYLFFYLLLFLSSNFSINAIPFEGNKQSASKKSLFDLLEKETVLKMTLETDLDGLFKNIRSEESLPASIKFEEIEGQSLEIDLQIALRGKYRRKICDFPPMLLNFNKQDLKSRGLKSKFDKMKLVTHCLASKSKSKSNVLREYMAYQIYEILTEQSFRTQLVEITYKDTDQKKGKLVRYGIIIEDNDQMAKRLEGKICDDCVNIVNREKFDPISTSRTAVFQYMISNADWSIRTQKNIKMITSKEHSLLKIVPYDFDFSYFVDASYAVANIDYKQVSIKDRVFLWTFPSTENRTETLQLFKDRKNKIYDYCNSFELICKKDRKSILGILDSFYKTIEDDTQLDNAFREVKRNFK